MNLRLRSILFLIFGPIAAVFAVRPILFLVFRGDFFSWNLGAGLIVVFITAVFIQAGMMRTFAGIPNRTAYSAAIVMNLVSLFFLALITFGIHSCNYLFGFILIPTLFLIIGITFLVKTKFHVLSMIAIWTFNAQLLVIVVLILGPLNYELTSPLNEAALAILTVLSLLILKPFVEIWPARLFMPVEQTEASVLYGDLGIIVFTVVTYVCIMGLHFLP